MHLAAILDHITTQCDEPGLSMVAAAEAQDISPRYLQQLIASTGTTFIGRMNELRLPAADRSAQQ